jgi:hypothetical protein
MTGTGAVNIVEKHETSKKLFPDDCLRANQNAIGMPHRRLEIGVTDLTSG